MAPIAHQQPRGTDGIRGQPGSLGAMNVISSQVRLFALIVPRRSTPTRDVLETTTKTGWPKLMGANNVHPRNSVWQPQGAIKRWTKYVSLTENW